ncbi:MAG TPA: hypothetical protein VHK25_00135, partial [Acidimicrobiales bacterium]|nr:hypothetical protein [Acidimicrobiales bacterium]
MSEDLQLRAEPAVEQLHRAAAPSNAGRRLRAELDRLTTVRAVLASEALDQETEAESVGELSSIDQHPADLGSETFERERELSLLEDVEAEIA